MTLRLAAALLAGLVSFTQPATATVQVGKPAPDFTGTDSQGKSQRLSDYRGKVVVLEWTNHDCPFVGKHYGAGNMQAQQKEAAAKGVVWLSIVSSAPGKQGHVSAGEANRLTAERGASPTAVVLDPEGRIGQLYGAKTTPHMYVIDAQGKLVYAGGIDSIASSDATDIAPATQYVRAALAEVLAGKPVSVAVTQPYGCSVKY